MQNVFAHLFQDGCQTLNEAASSEQVLVVAHGNGVAEAAVDVGHQHVGHGRNGGLLQVHNMAQELLAAEGLVVSLH